MNTNVSTPTASWHEVVQTTYTVAGAAGWVDQDISALVGAGVKLVAFRCSSAAGTASGVRQKGSAIDTSFTANIGEYSPHFCYTDPSGIVELYRVATNNNYQVIGYWE